MALRCSECHGPVEWIRLSVDREDWKCLDPECPNHVRSVEPDTDEDVSEEE